MSASRQYPWSDAMGFGRGIQIGSSSPTVPRPRHDINRDTSSFEHSASVSESHHGPDPAPGTHSLPSVTPTTDAGLSHWYADNCDSFDFELGTRRLAGRPRGAISAREIGVVRVLRRLVPDPRPPHRAPRSSCSPASRRASWRLQGRTDQTEVRMSDRPPVARGHARNASCDRRGTERRERHVRGVRRSWRARRAQRLDLREVLQA